MCECVRERETIINVSPLLANPDHSVSPCSLSLLAIIISVAHLDTDEWFVGWYNCFHAPLSF